MIWNPIERGRLFAWRWQHRHFWFLRRAHKPMPLRIYAGLPGSGKTLFCVQDAITLLRRGERVYSNIYIKDPLTGNAALPCMSWLELIELAVSALEDDTARQAEGLEPLGAYFVIDELQEYCDAREWERTPKWVRQIFTNRRHYRIALLGTTQLVENLEKRLRTLVDEIWDVKPTGLRVLMQTWFRRELPLFWRSTVDRRMVDRPDLADAPKWQLTTVKWEPFAAYGTHEHVAGQDLALLNDAKAEAFVDTLFERASRVMKPSHVIAFVERHTRADHEDPQWCNLTECVCRIESDPDDCMYRSGDHFDYCGYVESGEGERYTDASGSTVIRWTPTKREAIA